MRKNKYIEFVNLYVLLCLLLSVFSGISVYADMEDTDNSAYYIVDEDFNSINPNSDDPIENWLEYWGWDIVENGGTISYVPNEEFLMHDESDTKRFAIKRDFQAQTGGTVTWDFKFEHRDAIMTGTTWELKGDGKTAVKISIGESANGTYYPIYAQDNTYLMGVTADTAYGIRVTANLDTHTYNVYIDGIQRGSENINYDSSISCIDSMVIATGIDSVGTMDIRPVRLSRGYIVAEQFVPYVQNTLNGGDSSAKAYWRFGKDGGDVKIANMYSTTPPDILSICLEDTDTSKYVYILKQFSTVSDNLLWQFKFYAPLGLNDFQAILGNCKLKGYNNNLYLGSQNEDYILCENVSSSIWYTVKVNFKQKIGKADVAINGKTVCTDVDICSAGTSSAMFRFMTGKTTTDVVWLDDIYVSYDAPLPSDYVPEPVVLKKDSDAPLIGMQTCDLWREGKHFGWDKIARDPTAKPYLGYYDDGSSEVKDWEIKFMVEHGIDFSIHTWFRPDGAGKPIKDPRNGASLHDGLFNAKYKDKIKFAIEWDPATYVNKGNYIDFQQYIVPFWMEYYFKDPSYLKIDNKPVIGFMAPDCLEEVFANVGVASQIEYLREQCVANGFDGAYILAVSSTLLDLNLTRYKNYGFDGVYAYNYDYTYSVKEQKERITAQREAGIIPSIPTIVTGMDCTLWDRKSGGNIKPVELNELATWVKNTALNENTMLTPNANNLINDGGFEGYDDAAVPDNIVLGAVSAVVAEGVGVDGTNALKINDKASDQAVNVYFNVQKGKQYEVSMAVKRTAADNINLENEVVMEIYGDGGSNYISTAFKNEVLPCGDSYKIMKTRFVAPKDSTNGRLKITLKGTAEGILTYIDNIKCNELEKSIGEKMVMLSNWNEYGEGYFFMPTKRNGFEYLEAVGKTFGQPVHTDDIPDENQLKRLCRLYPMSRVVKAFAEKSYEQHYNSLKKWDFDNDNSDSMTCYNVKNKVVENSILSASTQTSDPQLVSPDNLSINAQDVKLIRVCMKNPGTSSIGSKMYFITEEDKNWNEAKSISWTIDKGMNGFADYFFDPTANENWKGTIKQLRFDPFEVQGDFAYDVIELLGISTKYNSNLVADGGMEKEQFRYSADNVSCSFSAWDYQSGYRSLHCTAHAAGSVAVEIPLRQGYSYCATARIKSAQLPFDAGLSIQYVKNNETITAGTRSRQVSQYGWNVLDTTVYIPVEGTITDGRAVIELPQNSDCYIDLIEIYEIPNIEMGFYNAAQQEISNSTTSAGDINCKIHLNNTATQTEKPIVWLAKYENGKLISVYKYEKQDFTSGDLNIPVSITLNNELRCGIWDDNMSPVFESIKVNCE